MASIFRVEEIISARTSFIFLQCVGMIPTTFTQLQNYFFLVLSFINVVSNLTASTNCNLIFLQFCATSSPRSSTEVPHHRLVTLGTLLTERTKERYSEWKGKKRVYKRNEHQSHY
jgi:Na+(H+)/acetate symporter ActP